MDIQKIQSTYQETTDAIEDGTAKTNRLFTELEEMLTTATYNLVEECLSNEELDKLMIKFMSDQEIASLKEIPILVRLGIPRVEYNCLINRASAQVAFEFEYSETGSGIDTTHKIVRDITCVPDDFIPSKYEIDQYNNRKRSRKQLKVMWRRQWHYESMLTSNCPDIKYFHKWFRKHLADQITTRLQDYGLVVKKRSFVNSYISFIYVTYTIENPGMKVKE